MHTAKELERRNPQYLLQEVLRLQEENADWKLRAEGKDPEEEKKKQRIHVPLEGKAASILASQARKRFVREQRERVKLERKRMQIDTEEIMERYDIRFVHVRRRLPESIVALHRIASVFDEDEEGEEEQHQSDEYYPNGGVTIAYHSESGTNVVQFAAAMCSLKDTYDRIRGAYEAATNFNIDISLRLPNLSKTPNGAWLYRMFSHSF